MNTSDCQSGNRLSQLLVMSLLESLNGLSLACMRLNFTVVLDLITHANSKGHLVLFSRLGHSCFPRNWKEFEPKSFLTSREFRF